MRWYRFRWRRMIAKGGRQYSNTRQICHRTISFPHEFHWDVLPPNLLVMATIRFFAFTFICDTIDFDIIIRINFLDYNVAEQRILSSFIYFMLLRLPANVIFASRTAGFFSRRRMLAARRNWCRLVCRILRARRRIDKMLLMVTPQFPWGTAQRRVRPSMRRISPSFIYLRLLAASFAKRFYQISHVYIIHSRWMAISYFLRRRYIFSFAASPRRWYSHWLLPLRRSLGVHFR